LSGSFRRRVHMKHLVIGSGGREHALGWKLAQAGGSEIVFAPGNGGTLDLGENVDIDPTDIDAVCSYAAEAKPDLITIGPEDPLALGLADRLSALGLPVFGPTAECARIESSKVFAKSMMSKYSIPTAPHKIFTSPAAAHSYVDSSRKPLVVKADGLARGKGAVVTKDRGEAHRAVEALMEERIFGEAGDTVVIEEKLTGEEASVIAVTDGERYVVLPPSQDHKPIHDGDRGPNTGGMGAYCPAPVVDGSMLGHIKDVVFDHLLRGLRREGLAYRGVIYAGLMIDSRGPHVIEFNARFGDPETQCMMPVIDIDLGELLMDASEGTLTETRIVTPARWAVSVVLASGGYPGPYEKGKEIRGLDNVAGNEDSVVFHAGTRRLDDGRLVTSGGRVLAVTGMGRTLRAARRKAYDVARRIKFESMHLRTDIGLKGLQRLERAGVR
jgi:phosphoribosylamine--glycine ligase